ncbi:hypothetical protein FQN50_001151 [Emmonsiellopsis sp. PD_5]|nr:hypothetical protein FQN50_001151 [Emmonsiellopsis sp. PD_5]
MAIRKRLRSTSKTSIPSPSAQRSSPTLPLELLLQIAECLHSPPALNSLVKCNRSIYNLLNPVLYKDNVKNDQSSAAWWALRAGCVQTLKKAIQAGADVNAIPDRRAVETILLPLWFYWGSLFSQALHPDGVCPGRQDAILQVILEHGADLNANYRHLWRPVEVAALYNQFDVVRKLYEHGAGLHGGTVCRGSLVHLMFKSDRPVSVELLEFLLAKGVSPNRDCLGNATILHAAVRWDLEGSAEERERVIRLLLQYGADVNARDRYRMTPLMIEVREEIHFSTPVAKLLLEMGADPSVLSLEKSCEKKPPSRFWKYVRKYPSQLGRFSSKPKEKKKVARERWRQCEEIPLEILVGARP